MLLSMQHVPLNKQREILDKRIEDWKGKEHQIDDILVIGVKV